MNHFLPITQMQINGFGNVTRHCLIIFVDDLKITGKNPIDITFGGIVQEVTKSVLAFSAVY